MPSSHTIVAERYRLLRLLGYGGMGRVWLALDEVLHREVAVKELIPPVGLSGVERDELRRRTLREARAAARLSHPNVVRIYDTVNADGRPWIVMEYVSSRSLHQVINTDGPLTPRRAAEVGMAVLSALRAAHQAGVLHRDIKPGNVLLADDGRVVLTDFGLATFDGEGQVTRSGLILGSPQYIAPERARDGLSLPESDLWSLGATLYAAVEGHSPYARSNAMATLTALATEDPAPATNAGPLRPVLNALLRKEPKQRATIAEADRLLRQALGGGRNATTGKLPRLLPRPRPPRSEGAGAAARTAYRGPTKRPTIPPLPARAAETPQPARGTATPPTKTSPGGRPRTDAVATPADTGTTAAGATDTAAAAARAETSKTPNGGAALDATVVDTPAVTETRVDGAPVDATRVDGVRIDPTRVEGAPAAGSRAVGKAPVRPVAALRAPTAMRLPIIAKPTGAKPVLGEPVVIKTVTPKTGVSKSTTLKSAAPRPAAAPPAPKQAATAPPASKQAASKQAVPKPAVLKPAGSRPAAAGKVGSGPAAPEPDAAGSGVAARSAAGRAAVVAGRVTAGTGTAVRARAASAATALRRMGTDLKRNLGTGGGSRQRRKIGLVVVAGAVTVLLGAVVADAATDRRRSELHTVSRPPASAAPSSTGNAARQPAQASPTASTAPSPPASPPTGSAGADGRGPQLPAGWHVYQDSTGFQLAVPESWPVSREGSMVYFREPGGRVLGIDQTDQPKPDPVADWTEQSRYRSQSLSNYQQIRIDPVNYYLACADWEYSYDSGGGRVHVLDRGFVTSPRRAYAIFWLTPESQWQSSLGMFDLFAATFKPAP